MKYVNLFVQSKMFSIVIDFIAEKFTILYRMTNLL